MWQEAENRHFYTTPVQKRRGRCLKCRQKQNAIIYKWIMFTDSILTKCSRASVSLSCEPLPVNEWPFYYDSWYYHPFVSFTLETRPPKSFKVIQNICLDWVMIGLSWLQILCVKRKNIYIVLKQEINFTLKGKVSLPSVADILNMIPLVVILDTVITADMHRYLPTVDVILALLNDTVHFSTWCIWMTVTYVILSLSLCWVFCDFQLHISLGFAILMHQYFFLYLF